MVRRTFKEHLHRCLNNQLPSHTYTSNNYILLHMCTTRHTYTPNRDKIADCKQLLWTLSQHPFVLHLRGQLRHTNTELTSTCTMHQLLHTLVTHTFGNVFKHLSSELHPTARLSPIAEQATCRKYCLCLGCGEVWSQKFPP